VRTSAPPIAASEALGLYGVILRQTSEMVGDCGFMVQEVHGREEIEARLSHPPEPLE
jgi:hypothetical protein